MQEVRIDPELHNFIEQLTNRPYEVGGTFKLSKDHTTFLLDTATTGQFARVQIPKGIVQFHTHTSTCRDKLCTLGIPSVQDLVEFTRAFMRGDALIHCLYSIDGCYCISVTPDMQRHLAPLRERKAWKERTQKNMTSFYATLDARNGSYNEFRDNWVALAHVHGIALRRYDRGHVPRFCLQFTSARSGASAARDVQRNVSCRPTVDLHSTAG